MSESIELERERSKERKNDKSTVYRIWKKKYYRKKSVRTRKNEILCSEYKTEKKKL